MMTLRGTVARLVMAGWETGFAGKEDGVGAKEMFEGGVKSQFVTLPGRLDVVFRKGEREGKDEQ